jgi:hypothetical protein
MITHLIAKKMTPPVEKLLGEASKMMLKNS